jgi:hypothetical protein
LTVSTTLALAIVGDLRPLRVALKFLIFLIGAPKVFHIERNKKPAAAVVLVRAPAEPDAIATPILARAIPRPRAMAFIEAAIHRKINLKGANIPVV